MDPANTMLGVKAPADPVEYVEQGSYIEGKLRHRSVRLGDYGTYKALAGAGFVVKKRHGCIDRLVSLQGAASPGRQKA